MSLAVASSSTGTGNGGSSTCVVTKPTGLAEGELMVALVGHMSATAASASGWTQLTTISNSPFFDTTNGSFVALGKVATSGDAAAANFTFTTSNESVAIIYRITRTQVTTWPPIANITSALLSTDADVFASASGNFVFSGGVTPKAANSLIIAGAVHNATPAGAETFSIATSDPTWTENADIEGDTVTAQTLSLYAASAVRSQATATGAYTLGRGAGTATALGILLSIAESIDASVTLDVAAMTMTPQAIASATGGANVTLDVASMTMTAQEPTAAASASKWVNTDKSSAGSITNTDKS